MKTMQMVAPPRCMSLRRLPNLFVTNLEEIKMNRDDAEDNTIYKAVVNHEEQYSIWPADRENALGWNDAGKSGTKQECLAFIKEVWTDMRPLSLRKKMEEAGQSRA
jgi:MbtH protein